jgi:hypothetical protein
LLKAPAPGLAEALAEPCSPGVPEVPLSFTQPARTTMAAAAEIRLVLRSSFHTSLKSSMEYGDV